MGNSQPLSIKTYKREIKDTQTRTVSFSTAAHPQQILDKNVNRKAEFVVKTRNDSNLRAKPVLKSRTGNANFIFSKQKPSTVQKRSEPQQKADYVMSTTSGITYLIPFLDDPNLSTILRRRKDNKFKSFRHTRITSVKGNRLQALTRSVLIR